MANRIHRKREAGELGRKDWNTGLVDEGDFWDRALANEGRDWDVNEYRERTNPDFELQTELRALIPAPEGATVRILDVGAGPLTRIGKKWPGRSLEIIATDPLAEKYNALVRRFNVRQIVPVTNVHAEKLTETFAENYFDLAYASNCLDHSYDPIQAIAQMLAVVKPGHSVYLWHFANVGKEEFYEGLHQWNFDVVKGDFVVSDGQKKQRSLTAEFGAQADLKYSETHAFNTRVVIACLKKCGSS